MISRTNPETGIVEQLLDARNMDLLDPILQRVITKDGEALVGFDIETQDVNRHQGLNELMVVDPKSLDYKKPDKLLFDVERTVITGFSFYIKGEDIAYYVNCAHADVEHRIPHEVVIYFVETLRDNSTLIIHNYCFERTMILKSWAMDLGWNYIDTMQMAVSAYNDDQYDIEVFKEKGLGGMRVLVPEVVKLFKDFDPKKPLSDEQFEIVNKVTSKQSTAAHSYNGYVSEINYGYGLKKITERVFGYKQTTFEESLKGRAHMGLMTGEEMLHYGVDDAYWCVRVFDWLLEFMKKTNPAVITTFFNQENPMPYIYSDCWARGWRVNLPAIKRRNAAERVEYVKELRNLAEAIQGLEYLDEEGSPILLRRQAKWYAGKNGDAFKKYRAKIDYFRNEYQRLCTVNKVDRLTDEMFEQSEKLSYELAQAMNGSISKAWQMEKEGELVAKADLDLKPNFTHYMVQRVLLHDLCLLPLIYIKGKIATDAEARGKMVERAEQISESTELWLKQWQRSQVYPEYSTEQKEVLAEHLRATYPKDKVLTVLKTLSKLGGIEQRIKLFINNYLKMTDPETKRMYPIINSLLNTRRMAASNPNTMQLSKRGESTYIRGFFLPERDDHLLVAIDWSQVELVLIGEASRDPNFKKAFAQIPYEDLHTSAALAAINVRYPSFTSELFQGLKIGDTAAIESIQVEFPKVLINPVKNEELPTNKAFKFWRGEAGKPSNFGYWYSGSLMTVQEKLGWTLDEMWKGTENYRNVFAVAEHWRLNTIERVHQHGIHTLKDGHQRVRYEATDKWLHDFVAKFSELGNKDVSMFGYYCARKIQRRAFNQTVNADIQGGCATLAKRSILSCFKELHQWDAFFIMPIHDELIFSVHHSKAVDFSRRALEIMCDHPEIVSRLKLDGTISIGRTLEGYDPVKSPYGQIELDEAPVIENVIPQEYQDKSLPDDIRQKVVDYLMEGSLDDA